MKEKSTSYYLIRDRIIAKREKDGKCCKDYLLRDGKWVEDTSYRFEDTGILLEMDEISEEQAISILNQHILDVLKSKWKAEFAVKKEEWDKNPRWPAKLVKTKFILNGVQYSLFPNDIGLTYDSWDQGFMETIQSDISEDLEVYGAVDIPNIGFID